VELAEELARAPTWRCGNGMLICGNLDRSRSFFPLELEDFNNEAQKKYWSVNSQRAKAR
jgi:hypothetical protein